MKQLALILTILIMVAASAFAESWTGKLVDAVCKVSHEGDDPPMPACAATAETHLFGIELSDAKMLALDAAGNEKASNAVKSVRKTNPRAVVTGSRDGQFVKVETIEIQ